MQKSRTRLMQFIALYSTIFSALGCFGYFYVDRGVEKTAVSREMPQVITDLAYYDLPRMTVSIDSRGDLNTTGMPPRMRLDLALEVARKDIPNVQSCQPRITENITHFLMTVTPDQVAKVSAVPWLRTEMIKAANESGLTVPVHDLIFRQLVFM